MLEACGETINTTPNAKNANTNTDATSTDATPRRVFITGGAGGVGTVAIQLAVKCGFSEIYTTASPGVKTELVKSLGTRKRVTCYVDTHTY